MPETDKEKKARLAKANKAAELKRAKNKQAKVVKATKKDLTPQETKDIAKRAKIKLNSENKQKKADAKHAQQKKDGTLGDSKWKKIGRAITKTAATLTPAINKLTGNKEKAALTAANRKNGVDGTDDNKIEKKPKIISDKKKARIEKRTKQANTRYQNRTKRRTENRDKRIKKVGTAGFGKEGFTKPK